MRSPLRFLLASLLVPAVVLLGETASLAQYPPSAPPPGYGPPPGQPMPAYSPTPYQPAPIAYPGYHEHDGFYLRLGMGGGYLNTSLSGGGAEYTFSGGAVAFSAAFGGSVSPNLIVYGEFGVMAASDPEISSGGRAVTYDGVSLNMVSFGPGLAYYIQPINLYVSGTLNFTRFTITENKHDDTIASSDMGYGFSAILGKEWWVSADWGLGVAAQFQLGTAEDRGDTDARLTGYGFALMFSATYN